ncbi:ABC-type multidrug transport system fused ATPase/permease subunit [Kribbella voronezhensis]|uniref:ABC-type multidrug transport system fused ATPase/permease subunit n=1 Tax=Kribbella voronezhensis TaxID=2512212 RepID=A0A4R7TFK7_9ACTN|nr:ABC transporter ATP-binding protein [Kribbella voronezhensis]TDU91021.1 ABC-type multidrug transport system fused ATPase/permease subunit [Kribbella voronezhensis]
MRQILPVASSADVRRYARSLARRHPRALLVALGLHALAAVSGLVAPRLIGGLVEDVQHGTTASKVNQVILVIAVFVVVQSLLTRWARFRSFALGEEVLAELREDFVDNALALPIGTVESAGTGDLLTRTSRDVDALSKTVRLAIPETIVAFVTVLFTVGAALLVGVWVLVPLLALVPVLALSTRWYLRRAKDGYLRENAAYAQMTSSLAETVEGARTVEALQRYEQRVRQSDKDIRGSYDAERYTLSLRTIYFPVVEIGYLVPVVGTLLFGGWLHLGGHVSLGAVTAGVLYVNQLIDPVDRLLSWMDELQIGGASLARLIGITDVPDDRTPSGRRPNGELVEARDVRFSYVDGRDVLHGVDLVVQPGERIAMVGPSGAGKSTLGRLVAGIHPPRAGSVNVGGVGMTELPLDELRKQVALVTQEHHVFVGTLRDNLSMARSDASDDQLLAALEAVDAREWTLALPSGLDTRVGSGEHTLTPAQAQQLALARLVLADPHTLVLDEATSLIDPRAARHMERSLAAVLEGRTVIAIAHRLYTAHDADRVAVVEDGRITELGSHDDLVAQNGSYAALWHSWHG